MMARRALWRDSDTAITAGHFVRFLRPSTWLDALALVVTVSWVTTLPIQITHLPSYFVGQLLLTMGIVPLVIVAWSHRRAGSALTVEQPTSSFSIPGAAVRWLVFVAMLICLRLPVVVDGVHRLGLVGHLAVVTGEILASYFYFKPILGDGHRSAAMPHAHRVMSLFAMMVPETMLGFFLYVQRHVMYPGFFEHVDATQALHQQQLAGALLWAFAMVVDAVWLAVAVQRWFSQEERRGEEFNAAWDSQQGHTL